MKILTTTEVQEQTGWSRRVTWQAFTQGKIQAQLVGRNWVTTQAAVDAALEDRRYTLKPLYSVQTAADYLEVDHWKIRRLIRSNLITPSAWIGGKGDKGTAIFTQRQLDNLDRALLHRSAGKDADTTYDEYMIQEGDRWIVVGTRNALGVPYSSKYVRNIKPRAKKAYSKAPLHLKGTRVRARTNGEREAYSSEFTLAEDLLDGSLAVLIEDDKGQLVITLRRISFLPE